jgi:hypothetical protein
MVDERVPTWMVVTVSAALLLTAFALTSQSLALAGDGAFFLVQILGTGDVYSLDSRWLGNALRQVPVLAAAHAGVTDTHVLSMLLGVGQLLVPALAWTVSVVLARADRIVFAAVAGTAAICAGSTWYLSVSENVVAVSLTALVSMLLWLPRTWSWGHAALATAAASVLVASYEAALVTGAVLAVWAVIRAARAPVRLERWAAVLVAALSILSVVVATQGFGAGVNANHSRSVMYAVVSLEPWTFYLGLGGVVVFVLGLGPWIATEARRPLLVIGAACMGLTVVAFDPSTYHALDARGGASIALVTLQALLFGSAQTRAGTQRRRNRVDARLLTVPVAFVVAVLALNVWALRDWSRSLTTFRTEVDEARGVVVAQDVIPEERRQVLWFWTASSLSLIVRERPEAGVLVDARPSIVPFPPWTARKQLADRYTWPAES